MSLLRHIAVALASIPLFIAPAFAEKRVALVIGNGAYQHTERLPNPKNDAEDVSAALRRTGFETIVGLDLDKAGMEDATIRFARAARDADVAIFYYSGHALQFNGINYLMPVDAKLNDEADLRRMARVDEIVADVQQAKNLRILVLDSCRDNPLAEQLKRRIGATRGAGLARGLAKIDSPQGMILAFSTQAGSVAADGSGRNSPYTAAFLKHIESAEEIGTVFRRVSADVYAETKRAQLPELSLSLIGEFYLKGRPLAAPQSPPDVSTLQERLRALEEQLRKKDEPKKDEPKFALVAPPIAPAVSPEPPLSPERERSLKPRDTFKECDLCPEMVVVPAGAYTMGSPAVSQDAARPQHQVTFARPFAVGKFEVTFAEWDACVISGGCNGYRPDDRGWGRGQRPAINVSWNDAKAYVAWLSVRTGKRYRLLSEAEWEYAARAETITPFSFGEQISTNQANYNGDTGYALLDPGIKGEYRRRTIVVGSFPANAYNLHDMHGNVWEWVEDCWNNNYNGAPDDGSAWTSGNCEMRGLRGGAWNQTPWFLRAEHRSRYSSGQRDGSIGFRVARSLDEELKQKVAVVAPPVAPGVPAEPQPKPAVGVFPPIAIKVTPLSPERERALKPKDAFKECDVCPEMVVVPAGSFTMGSPANEKERDSTEGPQHQVSLARPFAVGKFAVTFDEWDFCVADGGCNGYLPADNGWGRGKRPVINVSWDDAKAYVAWLSRRSGRTYRLVSEAEREYVTRAGTTSPFWWGSFSSPKKANYMSNVAYGGGLWGEYRQRTVPVDSFEPNPFGLYQVHGNVWEWAEDCWNGSYAGAPADGSAWTDGDCRRRVLRGGSWNYNPGLVRSASRHLLVTSLRVNYSGLRVARTLD